MAKVKGKDFSKGDENEREFSTLGETLKGVTGVLNLFRAEINGLLNTVAKFVGALNPGLLSAFNNVMQNLNATIGFGLEPVLAEATEVFRAFAGQILPLMQELRPVLADLSQALGSLFTAIVSAVVTQLRIYLLLLAPLVKYTSDMLGIFATLVDVYGVLIATVSDLVEEWAASVGIGNVVNNVLTGLVDIVKKVVVGLAFMSASLLRLVGLTDTLATFRANLKERLDDRKKPPGGLVAAPKDVGTSSIEDIAKKMSERAFAATGGAAAPKSETDLLEDILKAVGEAETVDWEAIIEKAAMNAAMYVIKNLPGRETFAAVSPVVSTVTDTSATGTDRARAARRGGAGDIGAALAVGAGLIGDAADAIGSLF